MAFVDRDVATDFTSLNPGEYPNLSGLGVAIQADGLLSPTYESSQLFDDGAGTIFVRFFFSAALNASQDTALDTIVADHLPTDDEPEADETQIEDVGTINGIDFDTFTSDTSNHVNSQANPHNTRMANLPSFTLAELNAKAGVTLDDASNPRDPNAHQSSHIAGGTDEIPHNNLAGLTTGDPHTQYTTPTRARAAAPVQRTTGVPSNALGSDGDLAIDPAGITPSLYEKTLGVWGLSSSLVGPEGPIGFGLGAFARVAGDGTVLDARGLTVVRTGAGTYQYTFTTPSPDTNYAVVGQVIGTVTDTNFQVPLANITTNGFLATIGQGDNGTAADVLMDEAHAVFILSSTIQGPSGITSAYESWLAIGNVGTEADFINFLIGPAGPGVPTGGATGQFLQKQSATDFDLSYVTLSPGLIGAEVAGAAATAIANHVAEADPHTQYLNMLRFQTEVANLDTGDIAEGSNLYFTQARVSANVDVAANTVHRGRTDNPHGTTAVQVGAIPDTEKGAVGGVATLDGTGKIPTSQIPASALPEFTVVADIPARDALVAQEGDEVFVVTPPGQFIFDGTNWIERPANPNSVTGPGSAVDNSIPRFDGTTGKVIQGSGVSVDDLDNLNVPGDITLGGTVDGVDLASFESTTTAHIASNANPHGTSIGNIQPGTLAELNTAITDGTLDTNTDSRPPDVHATTHQQGGSDELLVQNLGSGALTTGVIFAPDGSGGVTTIAAPITLHANLGGLTSDDHPQYLLVDGSRAMADDLDMGGNSITNVNEVDGVDISVFQSDTQLHIADDNNPHDTSILNIPDFTLGAFNSKLQGGDVDFSFSTRDPNPHASNHSQGGSDEITLTNLASGSITPGLVVKTNASGSFDLVAPTGTDPFPTISLYNTTDGSNLNTSAFAGVDLDGVNAQDTDFFSFTPGTSQVTILQTGLYSVEGSITVEQTGGNNRSEGTFRVTRNGAVIPGVQGSFYSRQIAQGRESGSKRQVLTLNAGDVIELQARRQSGSGTLRPDANSCGLIIESRQGIQGPQGPQGLPGTGSTILLNDDGAFIGAFTNVNFVAATVTDAGGGQANVQFNPASVIKFTERQDANLSFADNNARDRVTLTETLDPGEYEILAYCEHFSTSTTTEWTVNVLQDGSEIAQQQVEPEDGNDEFQFSFWDEFTVASTSSVTFILRIQRRTGSGTVNIRRARISVRKLS